MKLFWERSELEVSFILKDEEKELLTNRTNINKLGFAVLMKFVQYERRFPNKSMLYRFFSDSDNL